MTYKTRKRLALLSLLIGMPAYVVFAVSVLNNTGRLPKSIELGIYIILGIVWIFPLRRVFKGIGRSDPDA